MKNFEQSSGCAAKTVLDSVHRFCRQSFDMVSEKYMRNLSKHLLSIRLRKLFLSDI